jgi:hypothetical protein
MRKASSSTPTTASIKRKLCITLLLNKFSFEYNTIFLAVDIRVDFGVIFWGNFSTEQYVTLLRCLSIRTAKKISRGWLS